MTEKSNQSLTLEATVNKFSPFLMEIRKRVFFTASLIVIIAIVGFVYSDKIISLIVKIFGIGGVNLLFTSPFQFINLSLSISFMLAVAILFPLILLQIISFLKPALRKTEFRLLLYLLPFSVLLFVMGFGFGVVIMKYIVAASYLQSVKLNLGNFLDISELISQILTTATLMGVAFQFPVILTALMRLKVIKHKRIAKSRFWAYIVAALFAGLLPPADIPSTIVYFIVLVLLFETTLLLNRLIGKTHLN